MPFLGEPPNRLRLRLNKLRKETPQLDFLKNLTPEALKEELTDRE